jgi:hypothetical protein
MTDGSNPPTNAETKAIIDGVVRELQVLSLRLTPEPSGEAIEINAGDNLQAALDGAEPGDLITLEPGAAFMGTFTLPQKPAGAPITIQSRAPLPERRITPADAPLLARIGSGTTAPALHGVGTANWRFSGIELLSTNGQYNVVYTEQDSHHLTFDRVLLIGVENGPRNGLTLNGGDITVTRCHLANISNRGVESHAIVAWDGAGPYTIRDNYLEAASINILFGGAQSSAEDHIPSDILVEGNHLSKRLEWKDTGRAIKNLFELKNAQRVQVRNNLMEHNWPDAQDGHAVLVTVRAEQNEPWAVVKDVLFERNHVRLTEGAINLLGTNDGAPSQQATGLVFQHNVFECNRFLKAGGECGEVRIEHNTIQNLGNHLMVLYLGGIYPTGETYRKGNYAIKHLTYRNNLAYHGSYGVFGDEIGAGLPALEGMTESYDWTHNVLANAGGTTNYPNQNWYPPTEKHRAQFNADSTLTPTSAYRKAGSDGEDLGA